MKKRPEKKPKTEIKSGKKETPRSQIKHRKYLSRRAERRDILTRGTEDRVERFLIQKQTSDELISFKRHDPEDNSAISFTVVKKIDKEDISASFGVIVSRQQEYNYSIEYPNETLMIIPPEMKNETIWKRINKILEENKKARA